MSHYFKNDPLLESKESIIEYTYDRARLKLVSDFGVFSKERVDFGTNILINKLLEYNLEKSNILDIGCGYGIIGLAIAAKNKNSFITMVDVNERAIFLAKKNKELNNLTNIDIFKSDGYEKVSKTFDFIITNPPIRAGKEVVDMIVLGGINYLNNNGSIFVVIQKKQGAPSLIERMETIYNEVEVVEKIKGYYIIRGIKKT